MTHIPDSENGRTYCGRPLPPLGRVVCIDIRHDVVDSATCKACQRVDDARVVRNYRRECAAAGVEP